jgi:two-component system chemotaxis response regulator CheB
VLLTQHMPPTFTAMLAEQLERTGERPAAEARDGEPILPGRIYVAPGGWHMTVGRSGKVPVIRLNQEPPEHLCRPSVDPMLRSAAAVYGHGVLAVILTGMGADGAEGCRAVAEPAGGSWFRTRRPAWSGACRAPPRRRAWPTPSCPYPRSVPGSGEPAHDRRL